MKSRNILWLLIATGAGFAVARITDRVVGIQVAIETRGDYWDDPREISVEMFDAIHDYLSSDATAAALKERLFG